MLNYIKELDFNPKKNTTINFEKDLIGVGVAQKGSTVNQTINNIFPESKIPKQLTSKVGKSALIGRERELKEIDIHLKISNSLLIYGIGGIGKSTIASYYLHSQKNRLDYYGFFEGIDSFIPQMESTFNLENEQSKNILLTILLKLRELKGDKLLVIDDIKNIEENKNIIEQILELRYSGYKILLISREKIEYVESFYLDILSIDDGKKFFNSIYVVKDELLLEEILEYLDCHTFFIEMTAKTLKSKKSLTPIKIKKMFMSGEFSKVSIKRRENFNIYLNKLFSFETLNKEEKVVLKKLTILPSIEIDFEYLEKILNVPNIIPYVKITFFKGMVTNENFEEVLNSLSEKGWLNRTDDGYKLHQIIKEYISINYPLTFLETNKIITSILKMANSCKVLDEKALKNDFISMESILTFLIKRGTANKDIADYCNGLGEMYFSKGLYRKASFSYYQAIEIFSGLRKKYPDIAISYNGLGVVHSLNGEFEKAKEYHLIALKIQERMLGKINLNTAKTYAHLSNYYKSKHEYKIAEIFYLEAIEIEEKILGIENAIIAISYTNLANLYNLLKEYDRAEYIYIKALTIMKKVFGTNHVKTAVSYMNLALFYNTHNDFKKAKRNIVISLKIFKIILPSDNHFITDLEKELEILEVILKSKETQK